VLLEPASELPVRTMNVTCWEWAGTARDEGDEAAEWLSEYLGKPVRLVRYMGAGPGVSSRVGPGLPRLLPVSLLGAGGGMQTMWAYSRCCRRAGQLQLRARLAQPAALRLEACLREFLVYRSAMPTRACTPTSSASEQRHQAASQDARFSMCRATGNQHRVVAAGQCRRLDCLYAHVRTDDTERHFNSR